MRFSRPRSPLPPLIAAAALTLSACDPGAGEAPPSSPPTESAARMSPAREAGSDKSAAATPEATAPAKAGGPDLSAYVGKYPFDKIDGVAFGEHPLVRAGIAATVTDARVRKAITVTQGPSAPIETIGGKIASWSCQQHKCGEHQWMILVDPATGATDVCYTNDPAMANESRWFLAGGTEEKRKGDCSSGKG